MSITIWNYPTEMYYVVPSYSALFTDNKKNMAKKPWGIIPVGTKP
jgi:hypothetical protein